MRVLGLDPGLRHTGLGRGRCRWQRAFPYRPRRRLAATGRGHGGAAGRHLCGRAGGAGGLSPGGGGGGRDLPQSQPCQHAQARHGARRRAGGCRLGRPAGQRICGAPGQEGRGRHRQGRQGPGGGDDRHPVARRRCRQRRCRRCAGGGGLPRPSRAGAAKPAGGGSGRRPSPAARRRGRGRDRAFDRRRRRCRRGLGHSGCRRGGLSAVLFGPHPARHGRCRRRGAPFRRDLCA